MYSIFLSYWWLKKVITLKHLFKNTHIPVCPLTKEKFKEHISSKGVCILQNKRQHEHFKHYSAILMKTTRVRCTLPPVSATHVCGCFNGKSVLSIIRGCIYSPQSHVVYDPDPSRAASSSPSSSSAFAQMFSWATKLLPFTAVFLLSQLLLPALLRLQNTEIKTIQSLVSLLLWCDKRGSSPFQFSTRNCTSSL